ncbi:MAG: hypothetical protein MUC67_10055 [Acidobacteria bacterium]|nr:hypothetical protein [Acidobacteriota bacterium]
MSSRPCGIHAEMNQLQDREVSCEPCGASRAGVPISVNVRGLCGLEPGLPGSWESIRLDSAGGRSLEHGRPYRSVNERDDGSAWDAFPDGRYERRRAAEGAPRRAAQEKFVRLVREPAGEGWTRA